MSVSRKTIRAVQRAVGTTPDVAMLNNQLGHILSILEQQAGTIAHLQAALDSNLRREFDSLAAAHAEGMVYLNRTLREIRVEITSLASSQLTVEELAQGRS